MGWEGDNVFPRAGVFELFDANDTSLGILATWYESVPGMKYVNEWRVHVMPLPDTVKVLRTNQYAHPVIDGDTLALRRQQFLEVWGEYKVQNATILLYPVYDPDDPTTEPGLVDREWIGTIQDGQGFNLQGAGSATTYGGPPPANRNP